MAKKKSFFGTLLKLGGIAAVTVAVYNNRPAIKGFLSDLAERYVPADTAAEETSAEEPKIVIDATENAEKIHRVIVEDTAEE